MSDQQTRFTRRRMLGTAGAAGTAYLVAGGPGESLLEEIDPLDSEAEAATGSCTLTPQKTEGPYFVDERLNRRDIRSGQAGVPLVLSFNLFSTDHDCAPVKGATVDIWHANAYGQYSDVQNMGPGGNTSGQTFLRGLQTTDGDGNTSFLTIFPGWYSGRAIHIHFKVRLFDGSSATYEFTSQVFFEEPTINAVIATDPYDDRGAPDTRNSGDNIYGSDGASLVVDLEGSTATVLYGIFDVGLRGVPSSALGGTTSPADGADDDGSSSSAAKVKARLVGRRFSRTADGRRILHLKLDADEPVTATAKIVRDGRTLGRRRRKLRRGTRRPRVGIDRRAHAGRAQLRLTLKDRAGNRKVIRRAVRVPRKRRRGR